MKKKKISLLAIVLISAILFSGTTVYAEAETLTDLESEPTESTQTTETAGSEAVYGPTLGDLGADSGFITENELPNYFRFIKGVT